MTETADRGALLGRPMPPRTLAVMGSEGLKGRPGAEADDEATLLIRRSADKARCLAERAKAEIAAIGDAVNAGLKGIRRASAAEAEAVRTRAELEARRTIDEAEGGACAVRVKTEQDAHHLRLQAAVALVSVIRRMNAGAVGDPELFERLRAELSLAIDRTLASLPTDLVLPAGLGSVAPPAAVGAVAAPCMTDADIPALRRIRRRQRIPAPAPAAGAEDEADSPGVRLFGARGEHHHDASPLAGRLGLSNGRGHYPEPAPTGKPPGDGSAKGGTEADAATAVNGADHPLNRLFRGH